MPNILLVEDDAALSELIASYLERNGYHVSVLSRGDHVRERARLNPPDLVIRDLRLPGLDGLQVCRLRRADSAGLPILMLTARDDSHDQVLGLEMGADDYVTKPCEPRTVGASAHLVAPQQPVRPPGCQRPDHHGQPVYRPVRTHGDLARAGGGAVQR